MTSDNVLCTICLEPINIINKENLHSIKYISPIVDEIENVSSDIEDSSPHQVNLSPISFDISTSESPDSESISPSIQQTYIETPELQTIIEQEKDYINPCECKNPIHIKCFLDWLSYKNTTTCEICNSQYTLDIDIYNEYVRNMNNEYDIENNEYDIDNNEYNDVINNNNNNNIDIERERERQYWINTDRLIENCIDYSIIFIKYLFVCIVIILMIFLMVTLFF
tara:strand:+ start:5698 stop:6369 length:672 start_codon:yes stop_codon:yes gene_type:complete